MPHATQLHITYLSATDIPNHTHDTVSDRPPNRNPVFLFFLCGRCFYHAGHNEFLSLNRHSCTSTTHPQPICRMRASGTSPPHSQPIYQTPPKTRFQIAHRAAPRALFFYFFFVVVVFITP